MFKKKFRSFFFVEEITFAVSVAAVLYASPRCHGRAVPLASPGQAGGGDAPALSRCQHSRCLSRAARSWKLPLAG